MLDRNVRGIGIALCLLTLFIFLSGCRSLKDDTLLTVNAVITEVDTGKQTITVKDDADENTLGEAIGYFKKLVNDRTQGAIQIVMIVDGKLVA